MKKVLIWIPLAENANWRGEGIAQSVENIICYSGDVIQFDIYTAKSVAGEILDSFNEKQVSCRVNFLNGVSIKKKKGYQLIDVDVLNSKGIIDSALEHVDSLFNKVARFRDILVGFIGGSNKDTILSKYDAIWVPSPIIKLVSCKNNSKIFYNFWDPFVFEYGFFNFYSKYFFYKRFAFIRKAGYGVITQSEFNKKYLTEVLGFEGSKVSVARLGGATVNSFRDASNSLRVAAYALFPKRYTKDKIHIDTVVNEMDNRSGLFRVKGRLKNDTKVLFVTTQNRPYKGLYRLLSVYADMLKNHDLFLITTADIRQLLEDEFPHLTESVCMLRRVTNKQHQFLIQSSDLVIHPSYVEGGQGAFSMFEASMMGVPSLVNWGRHVEEFKHFCAEPIDLNKFSVDFDKDSAVKEMIFKLLYNKEIIEENVKIVKRLNYSWEESAARYVEIFTK